MGLNAAGLNVSGQNNPNWKGGLIPKICAVCDAVYSVKRANKDSRFCSSACVGKSQRGKSTTAPELLKRTEKVCEVCSEIYSVPTAHEKRYYCCSRGCSYKRRAQMVKGAGNPNWVGGLSRLPYPWNFREISKAVIDRDMAKCQNPACSGADARLTTHHINYDKQDCRGENLICLCSACNSKANFGRAGWMAFYQEIIAVTVKPKKAGGGWAIEQF